jgi:hypothetical protein
VAKKKLLLPLLLLQLKLPLPLPLTHLLPQHLLPKQLASNFFTVLTKKPPAGGFFIERHVL